MKSKKFLFNTLIIGAAAFSMMLLPASKSHAASMTLKVSHQFAAGDVRDQMGRVFGDMVTEKTKGEIEFRHYPAQSLFKAADQ